MGVADEKQLPLKLKNPHENNREGSRSSLKHYKTHFIFGQLQRWMFPENSRI